MPATVQANGQKSEKLPSAPLMHASKGRIIDWWDSAYISGDLTEQFLIEAETALPLVSDGTSNLTVIFEALMHQRARLKANQQLVEWGRVTLLRHLSRGFFLSSFAKDLWH